ncbi:MAG: PIN domain-containing protein [Cyclobacteriaceae bacterium]
MILVDTSVWISFLKKDDTDITDILRNYLNTEEVLAASPVFGELLQGVKNKREKEVIDIIWQSLPKIDEEELFIKAGELSSQHKLYARGVGLIDCFLLAVCLEYDCALWTLDKNLGTAFDLVTS